MKKTIGSIKCIDIPSSKNSLWYCSLTTWIDSSSFNNHTDNRSMMISSRWWDCWYAYYLDIDIHIWHRQSDWYLSSIIMFTRNDLYLVSLTNLPIIQRYLDQFKSIINKSLVYLPIFYDELKLKMDNEVQTDSSFSYRTQLSSIFCFFISINRIHFKILNIVTNGFDTVGIPFILLWSIRRRKKIIQWIIFYLFIYRREERERERNTLSKN